MKRTQNIDLGAMRKAPKLFAFKPLALAVTAGTLIGCSDDSEQAKIYTSADECAVNNPDQVEQCQLA